MQDVKLIYVFNQNDPENKYVVCDLDEGSDFADPLHIFNLGLYDAESVNKDGLYAIGGNLDIPTLIKSYKWGIFPWFPYKEQDIPYWYCPQNRFVIFPDKIHVGHSLRNLLNKNRYQITVNKAFHEVIHNCRTVNFRHVDDMSWLGEDMENLFIELYEKGLAKSVEVWEDDVLVGGFYGFFNNGVFQGESMFSLRPSASQVGLVLLCEAKNIEGVELKLIDTQFETPTFKRLGGEYISYRHYREIMQQ